MKNILLISPKENDFYRGKEAYPSGALLLFGTLLFNKGYNVKIVHIATDNVDNEKLKKIVLEFNPNIVAITMNSFQTKSAREISGIIKQINKDILIMTGGAHPSALELEILKDFPDIDVSVIGEGEDAFMEIIEGKPLNEIKGICYHPVPKGTDKRSFSNLTEDLALMKEAGINTIRVYSPIEEKAVLDEIHAAGLKVIISFGYNQDGYYDILSGSLIDYVKTFQNHDAILLWELGNEYNYHPEWFGDDIQNWYTALNNAADIIHKTDSSHPVATAHGELPNAIALSSCPNIDVWGMNVYRWDNPEGIFSQWSEISPKPMYLSEAGTDSYMTASINGYDQGENEKAQADATKNILDDIFKSRDICSGVTLFAFVDELWKGIGNDG